MVGFQRLRIATSLGYLLVGVILGPYTAGPTVHVPEFKTLAEFGVVLLLFTIGLNYFLSQLHALRHQILGQGRAQVVLTIIVVGALVWLAGLPAAAAFVIGAVFAQSSSTISCHSRVGMVAKAAVGAQQGHALAAQLVQSLIEESTHIVSGVTVSRPQPAIGDHARVGHKRHQWRV